MIELKDDIFKPVESVRNGFSIRTATNVDYSFWNEVLPTDKLTYAGKIATGSAFVIMNGCDYVGLLHHAVLWDSVPMLNMVFIRRSWRRKGAGRFAADFWEGLMRKRGYKRVMVCVPSDMVHQLYYRARGYVDCGSISLRSGEKNAPADLILTKQL